MIVKLMIFLLGLIIGLNIINFFQKKNTDINEEIIKNQAKIIATSDKYIDELMGLVKNHENRTKDLIELIETYEVRMEKTLKENINLKRKLSKCEN